MRYKDQTVGGDSPTFSAARTVLRAKAVAGIFALVLALTQPVTAQSAEDDLFMSDAIAPTTEPVPDTLPVEQLDENGVNIGGDFASMVSAAWDNFETESFLHAFVDLNLTLDARFEEFRVLSKATTRLEGNTSGEYETAFNIAELFADYQPAPGFSIRAGKQNVNWSVGYYFSSVDYFALSQKDPFDPEAERQGPIAIKTRFESEGFGVEGIVAIDADAFKAEDLKLGLRAETLIGKLELGFSGIVQPQGQTRPKFGLTATMPEGDFDFFAELVYAFGSERRFLVIPEDEQPRSERRAEQSFFDVTFGLLWRAEWPENRIEASARAQYLFNGDGYPDPEIRQKIADEAEPLMAKGELSASDIRSLGMHYLAAGFAFKIDGDPGFFVKLDAFANASDASAVFKPRVGLSFPSETQIELGLDFNAGDAGRELTADGKWLSFRCALTFDGHSTLTVSVPVTYADAGAIADPEPGLAVELSVANGIF